ncbi:MAG: hypothetical protein WCR45_07560, partial [Bacteroidaceae bacterium]
IDYTRDITVTLVSRANTLANIKAWILTQPGFDNINQVTEDLILPTEYADTGIAISWMSYDDTIVDGETGVVTRSDDNQEFILDFYVSIAGEDKEDSVSGTVLGTAVPTTEEVKVDVDVAALGYANQDVVTGEDLTTKVGDANLTFTIDQGGASNAAAYYDSGEAIRLYQGGATMSFTSTKVIVGFSVTFASGNNGLDGEAVFAGADAASAVAVSETNTFDESEGIMFGQVKSGTEKNDRAYIAGFTISYLAD